MLLGLQLHKESYSVAATQNCSYQNFMTLKKISNLANLSMTLRHLDSLILCAIGWFFVQGDLLFRWVDPGGYRQRGRLRAVALESNWVSRKCGVQRFDTLPEQGLRLTMVHGAGVM